jgi:hypothetical protein
MFEFKRIHLCPQNGPVVTATSREQLLSLLSADLDHADVEFAEGEYVWWTANQLLLRVINGLTDELRAKEASLASAQVTNNEMTQAIVAAGVELGVVLPEAVIAASDALPEAAVGDRAASEESTSFSQAVWSVLVTFERLRGLRLDPANNSAFRGALAAHRSQCDNLLDEIRRRLFPVRAVPDPVREGPALLASDYAGVELKSGMVHMSHDADTRPAPSVMTLEDARLAAVGAKQVHGDCLVRFTLRYPGEADVLCEWLDATAGTFVAVSRRSHAYCMSACGRLTRVVGQTVAFPDPPPDVRRL